MEKSLYKKLLQLLTPLERQQMYFLLPLMLISMGLETLGATLVLPAIALMSQPNLIENYPSMRPLIKFLGFSSQAELLISGMLVLVTVYLIKSLFLVFMIWKQNKFIFSVQASLSSRLFTGYLLQPWAFHLQRNSAQLILNTTREVETFTNSALQSLMLLVTEGTVLVGMVSLLFIIEPLGALAVVGIFGFAAYGFQYGFRSRLLCWGQARHYHEGLRIQHLQQGLGGAKDVKLLGRERDFFDQYEKHNLGSSQASQRHKTLTDLPRVWLELLAIIGLAALVLLMLVQGKSLDMLLPTLGVFAAAAFRLMPSVNRGLNAFQSLHYSLPVIDTLHQEVMMLTTVVRAERDIPLLFGGDITLQHVNYRYQNADKPALNNVTLTIPYGTSVGFIGASGAGKSTLVDIILGLLTPDSGIVKINGADIQSNLRSWQDQIGYVPQSIYLTDDTLRRNIAFGLAEDLIDNEAVLRAMKAAQLEEFIASLPAGLDTLVGERGVRLSGGQRQRIGIARALYHDPAVLVLDEATSSLDTITEKGVMDAVNNLHGSKTLVIVAHRISTVMNCDWLYKMKQGKIVEQGAVEVMLKYKEKVS